MTTKQKHLDLKSRYVIEHSLDSSMSFKAIARELGKDCTTISKEIRNHLVFKKSGALGKPFNDCALRFDCDIFQVCQPCVNRSGRPCKFCGRGLFSCLSFKKENCSRLSKPPYVFHGCFFPALFPPKFSINFSKFHGGFPHYFLSSAPTPSGSGEEPLQAYKVY